MSKLLDMFSQSRRGQSSAGMGFVGKNRPEAKPRAAALLVELQSTDAGSVESAIKAGADGLLFTWDAEDNASFEALKAAIDAAQACNEKAVSGLHITGGWDELTRESIENLKEQGISFIVLPLQAPASLLSLHVKDIDTVVTVPMRDGEMYPLLIRNLTSFDNIAAVFLDFGLTSNLSKLSIEDILQYRAVREAVRFPALINVTGHLSEDDVYTLVTLGIQAVVLPASSSDNKTKQQIQAVREVLEKVHHDDKDKVSALKP
jgi:2-methylisocitrate lyase-like PEP mutase family enzyme